MFLPQSYTDTETNNKGSSLDLQFQICTQFMRKASGQLLQKEFELMQQTSSFIEKIGDSLYSKDISTTQESFNLDSINDQEDVFSQPSKSRLLLRKSQSNVTLRRSDSGVSDAMAEVRRKCSEKTFGVLNGIVVESKRARQKMVGHDRLERDLKRLQNKFQIKEEEVFILKKKLKDMEDKLKSSDEQISVMKLKVKSAKVQGHNDLFRSSRVIQCSSRSQIAPHQDQMKKFLQQKERNLIQKEKDLKLMQNRLQDSFEAPFGSSCQKCCQMMKKIKESLMKYRKLLQEESILAENLYQDYKKSFA